MAIEWRSRLQNKVVDFPWANDFPSLVKSLALARGFTSLEQLQSWINPRLQDLKDPNLLKGIDPAVLRLVQAFINQESVALYGDFDLDGTSALALLEKAFKSFGFKNLFVYQPSRLSEGYGFHVHAVESLKEKGVSLILTADVGITSIAAAHKCKELEVDLIVTDHHLPLQELPIALSIINPNQTECTSGLGHLCGVGVAFYVVWALRRKLIQENLITETALDLKDLLDCFVIGTLTDMVPLVAENRVLVKHGLNKLAQTSRVGIQLLLEELKLWGRELSSQDVAIRFAPKLNALSRMELNIRPLDLFTVDNIHDAESLVSKVMKQNEMRVSLQAEAEQLALKEAQKWIDEPFVFICHESFHRGVIGLVATRLAQAFQKPAFVGSIGPGEGIVVASCRAPNEGSWNLVSALEYASLYLHRFGGHAHAAGFEFQIDQFGQITQLLKNYFLDLKNKELVSEVYYDAAIQIADINAKSMQWLQAMGPYGQGFEVPLFYFNQVQVVNTRNLKGGHVRISLKDSETSATIEALLFSPTQEQLEVLKNAPVLDILAEPQWNYFQSQKTVQLLVKEIRTIQLEQYYFVSDGGKNEESKQQKINAAGEF